MNTDWTLVLVRRLKPLKTLTLQMSSHRFILVKSCVICCYVLKVIILFNTGLMPCFEAIWK